MFATTWPATAAAVRSLCNANKNLSRPLETGNDAFETANSIPVFVENQIGVCVKFAALFVALRAGKTKASPTHSSHFTCEFAATRVGLKLCWLLFQATSKV